MLRRTSLFNISNLKWDDDLIKIFGLEGIKLPDIKNNADDYGTRLYLVEKLKFLVWLVISRQLFSDKLVLIQVC